MEREADFIGLQLMAKACFDPHEMPKVGPNVRHIPCCGASEEVEPTPPLLSIKTQGRNQNAIL